MASGQPQLTVVVPAYNETPNIRPLTERLFKATRAAGIDVELLIADDESEGTEGTKAEVAALAAAGYCIRVHARRRTDGRGLSSAVLLGFSQARHPVVLCMDADLQHEPESVPKVAQPILSGDADFSVGSRHVGGGGLGFEWSLLRRLISAVATLLAFPLTRSSDPMSGFFCISKVTLANGANSGINPVGFKIGLELMVRCGCRRVADVPITFQERVAGNSRAAAASHAAAAPHAAAASHAAAGSRAERSMCSHHAPSVHIACSVPIARTGRRVHFIRAANTPHGPCARCARIRQVSRSSRPSRI